MVRLRPKAFWYSLLIAVLVSACSDSSKESKVGDGTARVSVETYRSLLPLISSAEMADGTAPGEKARLLPLEMEGLLPALFQHPDSRVRFSSIRLGDAPRLRFAMGLTPEAWRRGSDGVRFRVFLGGSREEKIYDRLLAPPVADATTRWVHEEVSLARYAGQEAHIIFETSVGPLDKTAFDWALWGAPRLVMNIEPPAGP